MRQLITIRLCQCVLGLLLAVNAHAYEWKIGPWLAPLAGPAPVTLEFSGLWPDTCIPRLINTRLVEETLEMRTQSAPDRCLQSETLFSIPVQLLKDTATARSIVWLHRRENETDYQLYGFRLREPDTFPTIEPSSGWWWPESGGPEDSGGPGTGLTVDYQQGLLTLLSQAYDVLGAPEWQLATGALRGEVFNAPLIRFSNGQTLTGDFQLPDLTVGRDELSVQFHSAVSATVWFSHRQGINLDSPVELRAVSMIRYLMNPPVVERLLLGRWLVTSQQDTGNTPLIATLRITSLVQESPADLRLVNARGDEIGTCELEPDRPEAAPRRCNLIAVEHFGDLSMESIGYDRMEGLDHNGRRILAVRMPR